MIALVLVKEIIHEVARLMTTLIKLYHYVAIQVQSIQEPSLKLNRSMFAIFFYVRMCSMVGLHLVMKRSWQRPHLTPFVNVHLACIKSMQGR